MSKQALYYYAENLPLIQQANFTTPNGKVNYLGANGRDLLVWLCDAANEKQGWQFHMGYRYIAEETNIHISTVKRLMAGLEQMGWITRTGEVISHHGRGAPSVVWALTFYPPCAEMMRTGRSTGRSGATESLAKPLPHLDADAKLEPEPEPKPEPKTEPEPQPVSAGAGKEGGGSFLEVLAGCIAWERDNFVGIDRGGLSKTWEKEYRQIIPTVLADQNPQSTDEAVNMCVTQRNASRGLLIPTTSTSTTAKRNDPGNTYGADPDCTLCDGWGYHQVRADDDMGWTNRKCVCAGGTHTGTQEPTTKRVTTDEGANTYIPTPGDTADPQSAIRELTKSLRLPG